MICSKCCYCSVVGSKFYCAIKDGHIEGYPEICSQFHPVKDCGRCKNDPAFFNAMRELCNPCEFDYEVAKPKKMTHGDHIRSMSDLELARWFVTIELRILRLQPMLERPTLEEDWLDWLKQEVAE